MLTIKDTHDTVLSLPINLTTVRSAIVWVQRIIHNMILAIESILTTSRYVNAYGATYNYESLYAYVYSVDEERMHIHLAHLFLTQPASEY